MEIKFIVGKNYLRIRLKANKTEKQEIRDMLIRSGSDSTFMELTEPYRTITTADQICQLSECLVIGEDSSIEDDGSVTFWGKVYTNIHNYQISCPVETMLNKGYADFPLWFETDKNGENFKNPYCNNSKLKLKK